MTARKPYQAYKDSGTEWLGEIPAHWAVKRLKHVSTFNDEVLSEATDPLLELTYVDIGSVNEVQGILKRDTVTFGSAPSRARRLVRHGDIIISTVRTYLRAISPIVEPDPNLVVSTGFAVIRPRSVDSAFLAYAVRSSYFVENVVANSVGVGYPAINANELASLGVLCPSGAEQRAIARFLDRETKKIDALVAKKEQLIVLLKEKRTALITQTVTRGLKADVPIKDSGIEWLGELPAHWEAMRLKHVATCNDDVLPESTAPALEVNYVDIGSVDEFDGIVKRERMTFGEAPSRARRVVKDGDIIISTVRTYLRAIAAIASAGSSLVVSTGFAVIRPRKLDSAFAAYALRASCFVERVVAASVGVSYPALNADQLVSMDVACPGLEEQKAIASFLDRETDKIDSLVAKIGKAIERLKELRTALISAAVTGKIDVRETVG